VQITEEDKRLIKIPTAPRGLFEREKRLAHDQNRNDVTGVAHLHPGLYPISHSVSIIIPDETLWLIRYKPGTQAGYSGHVVSILVVCQSLLPLKVVFSCTNCCIHSLLPMGTQATCSPVVEMPASMPHRHAS